MKKNTKPNLVLWIIFVILSQQTQATVRYVKTNGISQTDGLSWESASNDLQKMIDESSPGDEVWVASGTYKPTVIPNKSVVTTDRDKTFLLKADVKIYGGFAGEETLREQRNWETHITVLSGDIGEIGDMSDNCYHVVASSGAVGSACLDGFTITAGNANYSSSVISINGYNAARYNGGGIHNSNSSPKLENLLLKGNAASAQGGAIYNTYSSPTISNSIITENSTTDKGSYGAGIFNNTSSSPTIINTLIICNISTYRGGGIYNSTSTAPILINVTIAGNLAGNDGGGISNASTSSSKPKIYNSIIWGNKINVSGGSSTYSYSLVEGLNPSGTGNLKGLDKTNNPLFIDADNTDTTLRNYRLQKNSPAINAGSNTLYTGDESKDLAGKPRINRESIDMGAYESQYTIWNGSDDNDWTNSSNWSAGVPDQYSTITIPKVISNKYPILQETDIATTDDITFEFGAELGNQSRLTYNRAFVEYNFADLIADGKYFFMTAPLQDMVSGDFFFGGKPEVWIRYAQTMYVPGGNNMTTTIAGLNLTKNIASNTVDLNPGFGFAYLVDEEGVNLSKYENILTLPRFENEKDGFNENSSYRYDAVNYGYNQHEVWDAVNNTSRFYYYYTGNPDSRGDESQYCDTKTRSKNVEGIYKAYRLSAEALNNGIMELNGVSGTKDILMGNPYLSHLDFMAFYNANRDKIKPQFATYDGIGMNQAYIANEKVYSTEEGIAGTEAKSMISPLQAVFITPLNNEETSLSVSMNETMTTVLGSFNIRNSQSEDGKMLSIILKSSAYSSTALLLHNKELSGEGVVKLFSDQSVPEVFIQQANEAKAIAEITNLDSSVPLGIFCGSSDMNLSFSGIDRFTDTDISLYDNETESYHRLTDDNSIYSFSGEGNIIHRFSLVFSSREERGIETKRLPTLTVYNQKGNIIVNTGPKNQIEAISVFDECGSILNKYTNLSASFFCCDKIYATGIYIVEVKTAQGRSISKVAVSN